MQGRAAVVGLLGEKDEAVDELRRVLPAAAESCTASVFVTAQGGVQDSGQPKASGGLLVKRDHDARGLIG